MRLSKEKILRIGGKRYRRLHSEEEVLAGIRLLAKKIAKKRLKKITLVSIANGAHPFAVDLLRELYTLGIEADLVTVCASTYYGSKQEPGVTVISSDIPNLTGRTVIILDDIIDTGGTMISLRREIRKNGKPLSIIFCGLCIREDTKQKKHFFKRAWAVFVIKGKAWLGGMGMNIGKKLRGSRDLWIEITGEEHDGKK